MPLEFPKMLYRGEDTTVVQDAAAEAAKRDEGWTLTYVAPEPVPEPVEPASDVAEDPSRRRRR